MMLTVIILLCFERWLIVTGFSDNIIWQSATLYILRETVYNSVMTDETFIR